MLLIGGGGIMKEPEILTKANQLLKATGLHTKFPLPIEKIAQHLGFECHFYIPDADIEDIATAVSHLKKKIYVNQNNPTELQRFSIARRIGNLVLHGDNQDYIDQITSDPKGKEADFFAENLLMPESIFSAQWQKTKGNINSLANYFGVSSLRIKQRAAILGLH